MKAVRAIFILIGKLLLLFAIMLAMMFVAILVYVVAAVLSGRDIESVLSFPRMNLTLAVVQDAFIVAGVWIMYVAFERRAGWPLGLRQAGAVRRLATGMACGAALLSLVVLLIWLLGGLTLRSAPFDAAIGWSLLRGALFFAVVAFSEELLVRGYVQGLTRRSFGAPVAVVVSSLLFAAMHFGNANVFESVWPTVNLALAGILFAVAREASGGLWLPIGLHWTWNYFQGYVYGFEVSGTGTDALLRVQRTGGEALTGGAFGAEGSAAATAVLAVGIAAALWTLRRRKRPSPALTAPDRAS